MCAPSTKEITERLTEADERRPVQGGRRRAPTALLQLSHTCHLFCPLVVLKFPGVRYTLDLLEAKKIFQFRILSVSINVTLILFHPVIRLTLSMFPHAMFVAIS